MQWLLAASLIGLLHMHVPVEELWVNTFQGAMIAQLHRMGNSVVQCIYSDISWIFKVGHKTIVGRYVCA